MASHKAALAGILFTMLCGLCAGDCDDQLDISGTYQVVAWLPAYSYDSGDPPVDSGISNIHRKDSMPCNIYEGVTTWYAFGSINFVGTLALNTGEFVGGWDCADCQILSPSSFGYFNFTFNQDGTMSGKTAVYGQGPEVTSFQRGTKGIPEALGFGAAHAFNA